MISPEGCASILWKSASRAETAADAMGVTAQRSLQLGLIDAIVEEPLGGAHRDHPMMAARLKEQLLGDLRELQAQDPQSLLDNRYQKLMNFGYC